MELISTKEIAEIFDVTVRRIQQLTQDGIIDSQEGKINGRKGRGYDLRPTIKKYIKYLSDKAYAREQKQAHKNLDAEKLQAETDLKKTKAKMADLQLKEMEGELHAAADVESMTTDLILAIRSSLLSLPGRLAADIVETKKTQEASEMIKKSVYEILEELSRYEYDPQEYKRRIRQRQGRNNQEDDGEE